MATETVSRPEANPSDFMAGVALLDELLREAERLVRKDRSTAIYLDAGGRDGQPLNVYARPFLERLIARPELLDGFAGALGDYLAQVQEGPAPASGDAFTHLTFEDVAPGAGSSRAQPSEPERASSSSRRAGLDTLAAWDAITARLGELEVMLRMITGEGLDRLLGTGDPGAYVGRCAASASECRRMLDSIWEQVMERTSAPEPA
jgi:hypothetical protein